MTRAVGRYVPPQVAVLWLAELALAFVVVYAMAAPETLDMLGESWRQVDLHLANHAALLAVMLGSTAGAIGLYRPDICFDPRRVAIHAFLVALLAFPVALVVGSTFGAGGLSIYAVWLLKVLALWMTSVLLTRWSLRAALSGALLGRRVLIVGGGEAGARLAAALRSRRGTMFELAGTLGAAPSPPRPEVLRTQKIWALVVADSLDLAATSWLLDLRLRGVRVFDAFGFCEQMLGRVALERLDALWFLGPEGFASGRITQALKRVCDVAVSLLLLTSTLPLIVVTAIAVRLDSPGPVLYRQERVGLYGRRFTLLKFRSMRADAEASGTPRWAAKQDSRVTRTGRFIRATRIDELPQLLNVLKGDMSLVGPRPERPHFVEQLAEVIPFYTERCYVRPGMTGWAQINYPYGASIEDAREKLAYDLYYVKYRNLLLDLLILASTVRVVIFREGAR